MNHDFGRSQPKPPVLVHFQTGVSIYDLIPPRKGGFVYGRQFGRVYFDLNDAQELVEKRELVGKIFKDLTGEGETLALENRLKEFFQQFAIYRHFKRSLIAYWIGIRLTPGNRSLIPGLDTALKVELNEDDIYRWKLADKIIEQIGREAKQNNAMVILVNIPYAPQIYDAVWKMSFGSVHGKYDRWIASTRLKAMWHENEIHFVDTTEPLYFHFNKTKKWLHYRQDGHPTPEGHKVIAETVASYLIENGLTQSKTPHQKN